MYAFLAVPFTTLPFLVVDGVRIGQSIAVARYLARKVGIAGRNPIEEALADGIVDLVSDYGYCKSTSKLLLDFQRIQIKKEGFFQLFQK